MAGQIRVNPKATKLAYKILKTPKDLQQKDQKEPSQRLVDQWYKDSSMAN